jgi:hypothetical protein
MTKKRSSGKKTKGNNPGGKAARTAADVVRERITSAGPDYLPRNLGRLLMGSVTLRQEPELADFYLDPGQTLEAAARHSRYLHRRMRQAMRRAEEDPTPTYDDYRLAVLMDLDTPQFRQDLQHRLEQCKDRLGSGHDADKLEMALFLILFLMPDTRSTLGGKKPLPLGVCPLVAIIYDDSFDQAMAEIPEARDIIDDTLYDLWCVRHAREDMAIIRTAVEQIEAFEDLAVRLEADPLLAHAFQRQESFLIEEIQTYMSQKGLSIKPGFFTADEAALPLARMEQRYWNRPWSLSRYSTTLATMNLVRCLFATLDEIVSPERMRQMSEGLKSLGRTCLKASDTRLRSLVPNVQAAIHHLQSETRPSQNKVVTTLYLMSLALAMGEEPLSPQWQRFVKRTEKSRLMRRLSQATGLGTDL